METESIQRYPSMIAKSKKTVKIAELKIKAKNKTRNLTFLPYMVY